MLRAACRREVARDRACDFATALETQVCLAVPAADVVVVVQLVVGLLALRTAHLPILTVIQQIRLSLHPQQRLGMHTMQHQMLHCVRRPGILFFFF